MDEEKTALFSKEQLPLIVRAFEEADADGSGGLDMEEFCAVMKMLGTSMTQEELEILHMKIDANSDTTVDICGFLYMLVSYNIKTQGLFSSRAYEKISLKKYPTVYVSSLLENPSEDYLCVKIHIFNDTCSQIQFLPSLDMFAICGTSGRTMVLTGLPKSLNTKTKIPKRVFESKKEHEFFTCVVYSPSSDRLLTGGTDGVLRVWSPHRTTSCEHELKGHVKPITHIIGNEIDDIFISLSMDMNVRVWTTNGWICKQSFQVDGMGPSPISSVCYSEHNNELVLANTKIGLCLGRGTDVFKSTLTSHGKPLCSALHHSTFQQVVSVCQDGVVSVWDTLTGEAVKQFNISSNQTSGSTAMLFNESQRKLITVSEDGKVRLWNFNSGRELAVLPVTVPKEVTALICVNNRLLISGKDSKIIFDLDMERNDHRFFQHDYLDDISSMDVHGARLVTASSNGNVVIWDMDTAMVLYWLNVSENPRTHMAFKSAQGRTGSVPVEKRSKYGVDTGRNALHKKSTAVTDTRMDVSPLIKCLRTREIKVDTATLLTCADGYIHAWSVISKGGLLAKFRAVSDEGAVINTMATDANEKILLTGDSTGRICLWDIQKFGFKKQSDEGPFENINGWRVSLCPPPLLDSWQAHPTAVVSVTCDPACKNIVTAGLDCNVRLWTNTGYCVGVFGRDKWASHDLKRCPQENADHKQAGKPRTAVTRNIQVPVLKFSIPSSPSLPLPKIEKTCDEKPPTPDNPHNPTIPITPHHPHNPQNPHNPPPSFSTGRTNATKN
ncbi:WD repeat-containing protein on Y chromosome-like [Toxotes jaculatrix]|uniref:WD repeat-containing protein on Y chromosome-like n=1 Tax=Toxotes jaculatrix TaxID=941984 RepID=UPI001B3AE1E6|nr:WD repeat-containing protein on Y chromosome-like [Toxotes jaculatrix]